MRIRIKELESAEYTSLATVSLSACDVTGKLQEGRQLDFPGKVFTKDRTIKAIILTDTGASAMAFVDSKYAKRNKLHLVPLERPCKLRLADGNLAPQLTHMAQVRFAIGDHVEERWCLVTSLGKWDLIVGIL